MIGMTTISVMLGANALSLCATTSEQISLNVRHYLEDKSLMEPTALAVDSVPLVRDSGQLMASLDNSGQMKVLALFHFHHEWVMKDVPSVDLPFSLRAALSDQTINQAETTDQVIERYFIALADIIVDGAEFLQGYLIIRQKKEEIVQIKDFAFRTSAFRKEAVALAEKGRTDWAADFLIYAIMVAAKIERPAYQRDAFFDIAGALRKVDLGDRNEEVLGILVRQVEKVADPMKWGALLKALGISLE